MKFNKSSKLPLLNFKVVSFDDIQHISPEHYLTPQELRELKDKKIERRAGWLASRFAVKQVVKNFIPHTVPTELSVGHRDSGAPFLVGSEQSAISLSHSASWGAAVVSTAPGYRVGIDIECVREFSEATRQAFLTPLEYWAVEQEALDNQAALATQYWVCKEAYLKARGVGLRIHPGRVPVIMTGARVAWSRDHVVAVVMLGDILEDKRL